MSLHIKKGIRNRHFFVIDLVMIVICVIISYMLRFEFERPLVELYRYSLYWMLGVCLVVKPLIYYRFGLYRHLWA